MSLDNIRKRIEKQTRCPHCGKRPSDLVLSEHDRERLANKPLEELSDREIAAWAGVSLDELMASIDEAKQ